MLFRKLGKRIRSIEELGGESDEQRRHCSHHNSEVGNVNDSNNNNDCNCGCRNNSQNLALNATVIPNSSNNGRTGTFRGQYRRRF